jgi:hypothetical protein
MVAMDAVEIKLTIRPDQELLAQRAMGVARTPRKIDSDRRGGLTLGISGALE